MSWSHPLPCVWECARMNTETEEKACTDWARPTKYLMSYVYDKCLIFMSSVTTESDWMCFSWKLHKLPGSHSFSQLFPFSHFPLSPLQELQTVGSVLLDCVPCGLGLPVSGSTKGANCNATGRRKSYWKQEIIFFRKGKKKEKKELHNDYTIFTVGK